MSQLHNGSIPCERLAQLQRRDIPLKCALLIVANGFEEMEAVQTLCRLRQTGICVKSIGLTSGLVDGAHGIWLMPDLTLADLEGSVNIQSIRMVILSQSDQGTSCLETEPRLHRLLQQTLAQGGHLAANQESERILRAADISQDRPGRNSPSHQIHLHRVGQPFEEYWSELIRCLDPSDRRPKTGRIVRKGSS
jgi:4-methyl-5(b-hydroxyethyl)-thiazole monophosphate biosynthesis